MDQRPGFKRNPALEEMRGRAGLRPADEIWQSDLYDVSVRYMVRDGETEPPPNRTGMLHLSIHRRDREPIGDWRHMQQIKNEVAGEDRWAVEVYPPERFLVDTSNEYHLWALDAGMDMPFGFHEGLVSNDRQVGTYNANRGKGSGDREYKGRQRPWQTGLTTGRNADTTYISPEQEKFLGQLTDPGE